jgi:hypothetical protein
MRNSAVRDVVPTLFNTRRTRSNDAAARVFRYQDREHFQGTISLEIKPR